MEHLCSHNSAKAEPFDEDELKNWAAFRCSRKCHVYFISEAEHEKAMRPVLEYNKVNYIAKTLQFYMTEP